ncbi:MAG: 2-hydroxyacid dehydrogenase [Lautropia sp.]
MSASPPADLLNRISERFEIFKVPVGQSVEAAVPAELASRVVGLLCTLRTPVGRPLFDALPALRVVSNNAVGFDNIDVDAATRSGVLICNTPGVLNDAVADLTFGLVLCLGRKLVQLDRFVRDGSWSKGAAPLAADIAGKTLGVLGMGRIGRLVAQRARAFGMQVTYHNRNRDNDAESQGLASYVTREALFREADFVCVLVPLSDQTRNSIGKAEFEMMKKTAFFVNTSRGTVVDEQALIEALRNGTIAGAGLDVMVKEPLPPSSPLCDMPNVVLLPHVGSATVETRRAMAELAVDNLIDAGSGVQPRAMVNPGVWPVRRSGAVHA